MGVGVSDPTHTASVTVRVICSFDVVVVSDGQHVALGGHAADARAIALEAVKGADWSDRRVSLVIGTPEAKPRRATATLGL